MLNFDEFKNKLMEMLPEYLPESFRTREPMIQEMQRLNMSYTGMTFPSETGVITPVINLSQYYADYESGRPIDEIARVVSEVAQSQPDHQISAENLMDLNRIREQIFFRVSDASRNRDILDNVPHQIIEDLAVTYHIAVEIGPEQGAGSVLIKNSTIEMYGLSQQELHAIAMENTPKLFPAVAQDIMSLLGGMMPGYAMEDHRSENILDGTGMHLDSYPSTPMIVVSNEQTINGAAVIFYPQVQEQLAQYFGGDFYILPSSVHETIVVPDRPDMDPVSLKEMVKSVNESVVSPDDKLTDEVYHYDATDRVFERASTFWDRVAAKESVLQAQKTVEQSMQRAGRPRQYEMEL